MSTFKATEGADLLVSGGRKKADHISERRTDELIIGLVGPLGSGLRDAVVELTSLLKDEFGYDAAEHIKLSDIIKESAILVGDGPGDRLSEYDRITHLQNVGNLLREKFGGEYLARKAIRHIAADREKNGFCNHVPIRRRKAFIIDSFKNPAEASLFREIYRDMFWSVGIFAPDRVRKERLMRNGKGMEESQAISAMRRDYDEQKKLGQLVSKAFSDCDFYIHYSDANPDRLRRVLKRYLDVLFCTDIITPNVFESAMYKAASIASNSGCISRKVGAAIIDENGELISVGWNDVPKFGGGLYTEDDKNGPDNANCDHRCYNFGEIGCRNDHEKNALIAELVSKLAKANIIRKGKTAADVIKAIEGNRIEALIEFSRAIHAEMEAILSAARSGKKGLKKSRLFVTTFPCHSCARHIIAAGISEVHFIEPYPKSKAIDLHNDAASLDAMESGGKVIFRQFEGIAPKNVFRFFSSMPHEKNSGKICFPSRKSSLPRYAPYLDSFTAYEGKISIEVSEQEKKARE